jgi:hypothetical protein
MASNLPPSQCIPLNRLVHGKWNAEVEPKRRSTSVGSAPLGFGKATSSTRAALQPVRLDRTGARRFEDSATSA